MLWTTGPKSYYWYSYAAFNPQSADQNYSEQHFEVFICLADDSHETSSLIFSEKKKKKTHKKRNKKNNKKKKNAKIANLDCHHLLQVCLAL